MRLSVDVDEGTWKRLRDVAEERRAGGRASVSRFVGELIEAHLTRRADAQARPARSRGERGGAR